MTKYAKIILPVICLLALGMIFVAASSRKNPNGPKFMPLQTQPQGPFGPIHYDWGAQAPFQNDKMWIFTTLYRNGVYEWHEYLFDLQKRKVVGEITNGGAIFFNSNQTKLLCMGKQTMDTSLKEKTREWLAKVSHGMIRTNGERTESFWVLDLRDNSAKQIGSFGQKWGYGSTWIPAPGFRYGYNIPESSERDRSFYLCDLEKATLRKIKAKGELHGWWDGKDILMRTGANRFEVFDVESQKVRTVFTPEMIETACQKYGLKFIGPEPRQNPATQTRLNPLFNWNGSNYDIFLSEARYWSEEESFLLKVEKSGPSLSLFTRDFRPSHMNAAGTYYIWSGKSGVSGSGGNGAVLMRASTNDTETVLVPPNNSGQFAIPQFYRDSVIYFRNQELWQIDLTGSNNVRLFPPPEK